MPAAGKPAAGGLRFDAQCVIPARVHGGRAG